MLKKITCITAFLITVSWTMSSAVVSGGSNISDTFEYPSHSCTKPPKSTRLFKPLGFANTYEVEQYNSEVRNYNEKFEKHAECIKKYIDNANKARDQAVCPEFAIFAQETSVP